MFRLVFRAFSIALALAGTGISAFADDKDGYVSLFNGKDLTGWKIHPQSNTGSIKSMSEKKVDGKVVAILGEVYTGRDKKATKTTELWRVEDGMIIGGGPMTHIFTEQGDFKNFHFRVECKINNKGNSGMFFRSGYRGGVPKGYECQINATHGDPVKSGSIYPNSEFGLDKFKSVTCVMNEAAHKPDEFFVQEVIADGAKLTTIINGVKQIEWTDPDNRFKEGHFALQAHDPGSIMTFRKVEVKVIK
ncbi:MAG: DUF1080 domain-containing protein [Gemmataceae bacterium]